MKLTKQQQAVVSEQAGNLLISAAAGSGKTSVMIRRITKRVLSGELDLRKVLIMTFTNAAAANMKEKIEKSLTEAMIHAADPQIRETAARQLSFLPTAHISTIHAFCLEILHDFGIAAKTKNGEDRIESGFITLDEASEKILFEDALDDALSSLYTLSVKPDEKWRSGEDADTVLGFSDIPENDPVKPVILFDTGTDLQDWLADFQKMTAIFGNDRSDRPLRDMIKTFHGKLRSIPDYERWIREVLCEFSVASENFEDSLNAKVLMGDFIAALSLADSVLADLKEKLPLVAFVKDERKNKEYIDYFFSRIQAVESLCEKWAQGDLTWDFCLHVAGSIEPHRTISTRASTLEKEEFLRMFLPVYEVIYYLTGKAPAKDKNFFRTQARFLFGCSIEEIHRQLREMVPVVSRFFETILLTDRLFEQRKKAENGVDFSDYEHIALSLLRDVSVGEYYRNLFQEIYIDEYQDNSPIQEAIVSLISRENTFAVGDVKQSIYRFRHARPQIFMEKMKRFRTSEGGRLLELNINFRSSPCVIDFVNGVFEQILSEESGEIVYDETQMLFLPQEDMGKGEVATGAKTEILLMDMETESTESDTDNDESDMEEGISGKEMEKTEKEAMMVALRILRLIREENVAPGDIAVLCRTNRSIEPYRDAIAALGIPAQGGAKQDFFMKKEILLMENIIRLLDNFCQDIPLAAVMAADLHQTRFSSEELLEIRLFPQDSDFQQMFFHTCVRYYGHYGQNAGLRRRVLAFLDWIDDLRNRTMYMKVSVLIDEIYKDTDLKNTVSRYPDGRQRLGDLETFRNWANRFESGRNKGLYRFVRFVKLAREKGASVEDEQEGLLTRDNTVHCLTIHKSKGLEFPYVFLVNLDRQIQTKDTKGPLLLSERFGIGMNYISLEDGYYCPTHTRLALEIEEQRANLAEEMRLFYVALTRAEKRLFLSGALQKKKDGGIRNSGVILEQVQMQKEKCLPAWLVYKAKSYLDFCLLALGRHPDFPSHEFMADAAVSENVRYREKTMDVVFSIFRQKDLNPYRRNLPVGEKGEELHVKEEKNILIQIPLISEEERNRFLLQMEGEYPYKECIGQPLKVSVSEIKRRSQELESIQIKETGEFLPFSPGDGIISDSIRPLALTVSSVNTASPVMNRLTPAEQGTILHSIFRYMDFTSVCRDLSTDNLERMFMELVRRKMLKEEHLEWIRPFSEPILLFCKSDLCQRMLRAQETPGCGPFREIPFSLVEDRKDSEMILVQGMIDCWFLEEDGAVLIDYKSDRIRGSDQQKRKILCERYEKQIEYYSRAIRSAVKKPVKEAYVWLIPDAKGFSF